MQPYFFPYLGYFSLISATDSWVVFDTAQFIRHGWIERNRVLNSAGEWQYIKVPLVKSPQKTSIKDIQIRQEVSWRDTTLAQLTCYKRKAPNYVEVINFLQEAFAKNFESISELNVHLLVQSCKFIGLKFDYKIFSEMNLSFDLSKMHAGSWAVEISSAMGADVYINPINGEKLFNKNEFDEKGVSLKYLSNKLAPYNQRNKKFQPGLSILDSMMFLEKQELLHQIRDFQLLDAERE